MSLNPQWNSFQPSDNITQDSNILDFKSLASNNVKVTQSYNFSTNQSSSSNSRGYGNDYSIQPNKNVGSFSNGLYGTSNTASSATTVSHPVRFPIGTFTLDSNNVYNNNSSSGDNSYTNNVFSNSNNNTYDSNAANAGTRETGIIEKLLHSYGFIQCCERQARLFFHFSQFRGNIEHLKIGDPVEFEMTYDRRTGKPIASAVTKIAPEVVMSEERVTGTVTTELQASTSENNGRISYENRGECFFLPYTKDDVEGNVTLSSGDKVSFQIATNNRGNLGACHIRLENPVHPVLYQGVICSMKESFGFIERADIVKEIFFHFSEAKTKEELRLGDDVEFIIQTRNGKEVACSIARLPSGTVIFEDLNPEILKGQVLKPIDRVPSTRHQVDALPGRIRYRAPDHSEVEISFGDKDQRGDFTLRHGDWVSFKIATDRRDGLNRATHISLQEESFLVSGEKREQGVIASLKDGYGFITCVERDGKLYFNFNEVLDVERELQIDEEFEFTVVQDQSSTFGNQRQNAIRMKWLPRGTVQFEINIENNGSGVVVKEIMPVNSKSPTKNNLSNSVNGECPESGLINYHLANNVTKTIVYYAKDCDGSKLPLVGDNVEFNINQVKRNKELIAVDVTVVQSPPPPLPPPPSSSVISVSGQQQTNGFKITNKGQNGQNLCGFIAALKDGFGFIETIEHDQELFFHFSNFDGDVNTLELGNEVEYTLGSRNNGGTCLSAENVRCIRKGTIQQPIVPADSDVLSGTVVRPLRSVNPDQVEYCGLIQLKRQQELNSTILDDGGVHKLDYEFSIMSLVNKRELLQVGDDVQLQIDGNGKAANVVALRKRMRATVNALKGHFGFLTYEVEEGKKLFFHVTEVRDHVTLQVGDTVEFVLVTNQRSGKSSACNVVKINDVPFRPERLSRLRTLSVDDSGPKLIVVRQPKGPAGSKGFSANIRVPHKPGLLHEQ